MKITIDLNYDIMLAIGVGIANKCAIPLFNRTVSDNNKPLSQYDIKVLYQYAFADSMQHLIGLMENKDSK